MAEDNEETDKIFRTSKESLVINVTNDELKYRNKYLPDPRRLSNDKILCTVCSVSLASRVRKGKNMYIHAILGVLVCKDCYNFYGDGIFSTDEDGDDKYCRWCGQGGTLFLCSKCNCGFCKKCMSKNMKNSALAEVEKDNWKCLICVPRPIFGSRAVCWASRELNNSVRKNEVLKLRLEEEKLRLESENKLTENEETSVKKGSKTKKRVHVTEDSDSSTVFIPAKKLKGEAKTKKNLNGSVKKHRRKYESSSSDSESSDDDHSSKWEKRKRKKEKKCKSSSSEESSTTSKKKRKKENLKKKSKQSSDESPDSEDIVPKSKSSKKSPKKSLKTKKEMKLSKRKKESTSDSSNNESLEKPRKKKDTHKKVESLNHTSSEEDEKTVEKPRKKKDTLKKIKSLNHTSSEGDEKTVEKPRKNKDTHKKVKSLNRTLSEEDEKQTDKKEKQKIVNNTDDIKGSDCSREYVDNKYINNDEVKFESEVSLKSETSEKELEKDTSDVKENQSFRKSEVGKGNEKSPTANSSANSPVLLDDLQTLQIADEPVLQNSDLPEVDGELTSSQQISSFNEDEFTLSYNESSSYTDEKLSLSQEDETNVKVHLAIEWLEGVSCDIADLGSLIAERTNKFGKRKVNLENLCSYEDVLLTLGKLKQLLGGIHTNYKQIEDSLEDKLQSWKILAGLEKSDLEEQFYDEGESEMQNEAEVPAVDEIATEADADTRIDENELQGEDPHSEPNKGEDEFLSEVDSSVLPEEDKAPSAEPEIASTNDCKENDIQGRESKDILSKEDILEKENEPKKAESKPLQNDGTILEEADNGNEATLMQELESDGIDNAMVKAELVLKSGSSSQVWSGLLSSDDDSDLNNEITPKKNSNGDIEKLTTENNQEPELSEGKEKINDNLLENQTIDGKTDVPSLEDEVACGKEAETALDTENFEALQELLYSSTEPEIGSTDSDSDDSSDIQLDDSDLEDILKPRKVIVKKSKKKDPKVKEESNKDLEVKIEEEEEEEDDKEKKPQKEIEAEEKAEEPVDSEAEIDMLTDLSKLKKKTLRRVEEEEESSEESSSDGSQEDDGDEDNGENKKRRKKYNNEIKKKREEERNELFGFLQGDSSAEDEGDITKNDLDVMEDQYVSESSDSMGLEAFSRRMNEKWRELEQEQDQLNLQMLLASESEPGSVGEDDIVLDSDENKKKKKGKKIKEEKIDEDKADVETDKHEEAEVNVKEEKGEAEPDQESQYEQFLEDLSKNRTTFTGLGSSSEEDKDKEEIEIKEELLSDLDTKVKKEPRGSDEDSSANSDSSADLFLDITKRKSEKKTVWRQHKLLRMKLSDTDTSDEERWWQRRLEREKKKKEQGDSDSSKYDEFARALSSKKSHDREKKKEKESGSDKENKKIKREKHEEDEEGSSSSTLEMSSTDSSGSEIFKKKKKKKRGTSDSDVMILSDVDKKKKKKKKRMNLSGESSNESDDSDDDVIDITQKSSQGESPGKGGRKNIRKVLTKHELAAATKAAAKEEEERKKRIAARQKLFNEMFEIKEAEVLEKLVLDFDPETKTELISVDKDLVTKMKPHQAKGVKFMWDSCFESLSQLKTKKGSGCILAHCMGLGKTFQVVSLVHTILTHKDTDVRTVLVVCPLSTVLNWYSEFDKWLDDVAGGRSIRIYHLTKFKKAHERSKQLSLWHRTGGVMILGYEMFRILANPNSKKFRLMHSEVFQDTLIDPGADLVVCDEGHMLKNESTLLSKAMSRIRTLRRIVLTGTPMQNNLKEYHCMVQFVKPNLLGTRKEFLNQFVNPITNGQFVDSTEADVKVMKRRAHVLHKMLEGLVQRFDYSVLTPFLPPKNEYVISLRLSDVQVKLYQFYLDYFCQKRSGSKRTSSQLFQDWQVLGRIWTHPRVLKMSTDKAKKEKQESSDSEEDQKKSRSQKTIKDFFKKKSRSSSSDSSKQDSDDEGSMKDFINDKSDSSSLNLSSLSDDEKGEKKDKTKKTKEEKVKKDDKEPEKKETSVVEVLGAEPVDEINLISSEEEDGDKKEEANQNEKADNKSENKANDSGIEDNKILRSMLREGNTGDELSTAEEKTTKTDTNDGAKESKEDEKQENKEEKNEVEKNKTEPVEQLERRGDWWKDIIEPQHLEDINLSAKLVLLFAILRECEMIEDKVLVFSQSLFSLDLIEFFLEKVDRATEENRLDESLGNHAGCWQRGLDYFRLDGSSSSESRSSWCRSFNRDDNPRARLFLISTRAGGLGINLTGANRVVIFDASWNPSHDIQSIFRIYRFGQKKPCYVYRFVAHGTMEEKVYDRQVAKQLLSSRVVDEQQVHRHFSMSDLNELYTFTPPQEREKPTPVLPRDRLMAELLTQYSDCIEKYHEHDSLLENIAEEELNEEERQLAWEDYENEKKRGFPSPTPGTGVPNLPGVANQIELFRKSLMLKFPNATDAEMNSMLQTLMYQVNYRTMAQVGAQTQPAQQVNAGPSQQPQNFRTMNSNNMGQSQPFTQMKNQKFFGVQPMQQRIGTNQVNQQRMGNGLMNQQMVGNGQIRKTNKTSQEIYMEQMRKQQEMNLARIQSQRRFQQQMQQTGTGQQPSTSGMRQPSLDNRVQRGAVNRVAPQPTASHSQAPQRNMWNSNQPLSFNRNRLQQMQKQRENAVNILSQKQLQGSPVKPVTSSPQRPQWKTPQQKQEEMRQRIKAMQQQKDQQTFQQPMRQTMQKGSLDAAQQRRLEEMKKRYNASRMKSSSVGGRQPISIVEIDDEPGT